MKLGIYSMGGKSANSFFQCAIADAAANMREMSRHNGVTYHAFAFAFASALKNILAFSSKHEKTDTVAKKMFWKPNRFYRSAFFVRKTTSHPLTLGMLTAA